jgi:hypothetical protein
MAKVGTHRSKKCSVIVTLQCAALLSGCGNGLSFGKGTYSNSSLSKASRDPGISIDANRAAAEQEEVKRFCDLTGRRPARIVFTLVHSLDTAQSVGSSKTTSPDERDERVAESAVTKLAPELRALQNSLEKIEEINSAALSKAPDWPGTEVELKALRLSQVSAVQLTDSRSRIPRKIENEDLELTPQRNLNESPGSPLLDDILTPLVSSMNSPADEHTYSSHLQQEAAKTQDSLPARAIFEANKILILLVARSAPRPAAEDIVLGRRLFEEKNFYVAYSDQGASQSALLLKNSEISKDSGSSEPLSVNGKDSRDDRRYSFTASKILAASGNSPANRQKSESAELNLQLSTIVDQALSCSDK